MTGLEHFKEAERLLEFSETPDGRWDQKKIRERAAIHSNLALAYFTAHAGSIKAHEWDNLFK